MIFKNTKNKNLNKNLGKSQLYTAFTLAEVLITLGIIGVVAAMTTPTLINKTNDLEMKSAWKKAYCELSQVTEQLIQENGGVDFSGQCADMDDTCLRDLFAAKIKTVKICGTAPITEGCVVSVSKWMNGTTGNLIANNIPTIVTNSGYSVKFRAHAKDCSFGYAGIKEWNGCGWMQVDVNGLKKPNTVGKDIFLIGLDKNKINPWQSSANDCTPDASGASCGALYLQN